MKKKYTAILTTMAALSIAGGLVYAGEQGSRGADRENRRIQGADERAFVDSEHLIRTMTRHLELDETQTGQVDNIVEAAKPGFDALRTKASEHRLAMRSLDPGDADYGLKLQNLSVVSGELAATSTRLRGQIRAQIHAVLTPGQQEKLAASAGRGHQSGRQDRKRDGERHGVH